MQKYILWYHLAKSIFTLPRFLRLLLMLLAWGLPYAARALGSSPTPPDSCWQPGFGVPQGTNGEVLAMVWARGSLYIGGRFTAVGGVAARNVARWDGHHWHSLGNGANNGVGGAYRYTDYSTDRQYEPPVSVHALTVAPSGEVYVGGEFAQAGQVSAHGLARWDGHHWGSVGDFRHLEEAIIAQREEQASNRWEERQRHYMRTSQRYYRSELPRSRPVRALAVATDGTLYVGGNFFYAASTYAADTTASSVARWNGRTWTVPGQGVPGTVHALVAAAAGRVYAGGDLWDGQRAEPDVRGRVACWDGKAWTTIGTAHNYYGNELGAGVSGIVLALAVLPNGTLYAAGSGEGYTNYLAGDTANSVARWDGHTWHYCGPSGLNGDAVITTLVPTPDGHLYAAGQLEDSVGAHVRLLRWNGHTWQRLGRTQPAAATSLVRVLAVMPNGQVYAGGQFTDTPHPQVMHYLARWTQARWDYLPTPGAQGLSGDVVALAAAPSGAVYAGGWFERAGPAAAVSLARWTGHAWQPLPMGCPADTCLLPSVVGLALTTDGQLYASLSHRSPGLPADGLARWDGHAWQALGNGLQAKAGSTSPPMVRAMAAGPAHSLYVAGDFAEAGGQPSAQVAKWTGTAWESLGAGLPGSFAIYTLAVAPNGDLYAGGHISLDAGKSLLLMVVRWDGRSWSRVGGFDYADSPCQDASSAGEVYALAVTPTGELYVGGIFSAVDGVPAHNLAHWNGTTWQAVGAAGAINLGCQVNALALNGNLYVGGKFENGLPVPVRNLARWDGRTWHAVGPGLNGPVLALACDTGNRLVVGGSFTALGNNGSPTSYFAVLDPAACQPPAHRPPARGRRRAARLTSSTRK
jgi:hypothetical protein